MKFLFSGQFLNSTINILKISTVATGNFHQRATRSIVNKMTCLLWYRDGIFVSQKWIRRTDPVDLDRVSQEITDPNY